MRAIYPESKGVGNLTMKTIDGHLIEIAILCVMSMYQMYFQKQGANLYKKESNYTGNASGQERKEVAGKPTCPTNKPPS